MRWFQLGLYDAVDSTAAVLLSGPIWPDYAVAHSRFREIIRVYHAQNDERPDEVFPCIALFNVARPDEETQLRAFEQFDLSLVGWLYVAKQRESEPSA